MNSPYCCTSCCSVHHGTADRVPALVPNFSGYSGNSNQINPPSSTSPTSSTGPYSTGPTGATGPTTPKVDSNQNVQEKIVHQSNHQLLLGEWKGIMGDSLIKIRFETTNQTNKILAFYTIRNIDPAQPSGYVDQPEMIATKISFDRATNEIIIRDITPIMFCGWLAEKSSMIFGKWGPVGNTMLYKV